MRKGRRRRRGRKSGSWKEEKGNTFKCVSKRNLVFFSLQYYILLSSKKNVISSFGQATFMGGNEVEEVSAKKVKIALGPHMCLAAICWIFSSLPPFFSHIFLKNNILKTASFSKLFFKKIFSLAFSSIFLCENPC